MGTPCPLRPWTAVTASGDVPQGRSGSVESLSSRTIQLAASAQTLPANLGWTVFPSPAPRTKPHEALEPVYIPAAQR